MITRILTHRGLEPTNPNFHWAESTKEAFQDQIVRGFGIEFDIMITADNKIAVSHDPTLRTVTKGKDTRLIAEVSMSEIENINVGQGAIAELNKLLALIETSEALHAIHYKGANQTESNNALLSDYLIKVPSLLSKLIVFDIRPDTAKFFKDHLASVKTACSVAHPYDQERYNNVVSNTLLTVDQAIAQRSLYDLVWLDEWDLSSPDGLGKQLYNQENFGRLRKYDYQIALVSPELHASSPGLLASECHSDGISLANVIKRWHDILALRPDFICTDFPNELRSKLDTL